MKTPIQQNSKKNLLISSGTHQNTSIKDPIFHKRLESIIGESPATLVRENQQLPPTRSNLLIMINLILSSPCEPLHKSPFIFERTKEAARHKDRDYDQLLTQ